MRRQLVTVLVLGTLAVVTLVATEDPPEWWNNVVTQSQIEAIFSAIDNVDIVIGDRGLDQLEYVAHRDLLGRKSFRIYGDAFPSTTEGCTSDRPLLSANVYPNEQASSDDTMDRDYEEEFEFIQWDSSYERFVKIWDQNQHDGYIVYVNLTVFEDLMRCLLDPAGTYLVVLDSKEEFNRHEVYALLKSLWLHEGVYRLFVLWGTQIWTLDPFAQNGTSFGVLKLLTGNDDLPIIPRTDFKGYPLRIDMFKSVYTSSDVIMIKNQTFVGADLVVSEVFVETLNFTPIHIPPDRSQFGDRLPNGTFTGVIGRLSRRESDITFVGFFIKDYFSRDIEFTTGVYNDELCCLVKKASRVPEYLLPITIFPADLWGLLFLMGLFCSVIWIVLRTGIRAESNSRVYWLQERRLAVLFNLSNEIRDAPLYRKMIQICIDTYIILLSAPYRRFTRSGIERLMLFGIMMVSLIFVSMFQSGLSSVFVNPVYYKDISNLKELDQAQFRIPVKYKGFLDDVFPANYSSLMQSLRNKMKHIATNDSALALVSRLGNIATITRKTTLSLDNEIYLSTKQLFMIPECPRLYNLAYVVSRHSVLLERINELLLFMLNGGLINHWIDQMNYNVTLRNLEQVRNVHESSYKVLTILDMQFPFYLLVIGLGLSTGAFVLELIYYRLQAGKPKPEVKRKSIKVRDLLANDMLGKSKQMKGLKV